jgi:hypothetical protein
MDRGIFRSIVTPYSMTGAERMNCLFQSLEYNRNNNIQGDYVECGVWKGGNILGMMKYLEFHNNTEPNIWLYDTFCGMTPPENVDVDFMNNKAEDILEHVFCLNSLEEVKTALATSNYPKDKVKYVIGDVKETLLQKENVPEKIALLRLDTDWYYSTKIELEVLWDKLEVGAPCIIDDYGHWQGCRKAVDEFFANLPCTHEFEQIDYTCVRTFKKC